MSTVEKLMESYGALRENADNLKRLLEKSAHDLGAERELNGRLANLLEREQAKGRELESLLAAEQNRLGEARTTIATLARMVGDLEEENASTRAPALSLVQAVEFLSAGEDNIHLDRTMSLDRSA